VIHKVNASLCTVYAATYEWRDVMSSLTGGNGL
jgi:hypothetical protein